MPVLSRLIFPALTLAGTFTLAACQQTMTPARLEADMTASPWYRDGAGWVDRAGARTVDNSPGAAKNIILFLGDGMGPSTVTAGRIFAGQLQGQSGEEYRLSFENFPWAGLVKTYNTDSQVPDSAGTMTAIMTGVKTRAGVIGIDGRPLRADCADYLATDGAGLLSALALAEIAGKATGVVTTARLTHATPAATYANSPERNWEGSQDLPPAAKAAGCTDIASQLIDFDTRLEARVAGGRDIPAIDGIDVAFGGGRSNFFGADPASLAGFAEAPGEGRRDDGRNLIREWQDKGGRYVMDQRGLEALDSHDDSNVLGLFQASHMRYAADRGQDVAGEPDLAQMTSKAIELLRQDRDGFFLMVEGGRIDHAHHANNAYNALNETSEFSKAIQAAVDAVDLDDTLIIVTADHSHVFTMAGYPTRGNPILGKVVGNDAHGNPETTPTLDRDGLPYTTLGYANGAGFDDNGDVTDGDARSGPPAPGRHDLSNVDTTAPGYHQETFVATSGETHGGEDVGIYAIGPGSHLVSGSLEQNVIFHIMNHAGDLEHQAEAALQ